MSNKYCIDCFSQLSANNVCLTCGVTQLDNSRDRRSLKSQFVINNKYKIGRVLGSGGFGITYLALDISLRRRVAIKEFVPNGLVSRDVDGQGIVCHSDEEQEPFLRGLDRFLQEGRFLAKFDHPNIVKILDVFKANGTAYLVMEYLEGRTLKSVLSENGKFTEKDTFDVMTFVLDALRTTHEHGIIHRDIKPDNIYLTVQGRIILLDFGGAKQLTTEGDRSMDAMFAHGYAAPEQYVGNSERVGAWTDVYAAAATMYKLMSAKTPLNALDRNYSDTSALDWSDVTVSRKLIDVIEKAMSLSHLNRFSTISEFQDAIVDGIPIEDLNLSREVLVSPIAKTSNNNNKRIFFSITTLIFATLIIFIFKWRSDSEEAMRQRVKSAIAIEGLRDRLSQYWSANGRFPNDLQQLGGDGVLPDAEIRKLEIVAGQINIDLAIPGLEGRRLQLRPTGVKDNRVTFDCWSLDLPEKYVPKDICKVQ